MKKAKVIALGAAAATNLAAIVPTVVLPTTQANATLTCTPASTANTAVTCSATASAAWIQTAFSFTGSNGVLMNGSDTTSGVAVCSAHISGSGTKYGLTTAGGSMQVTTGTAAPSSVTASYTASGCS